jgi:hypothetical protein
MNLLTVISHGHCPVVIPRGLWRGTHRTILDEWVPHQRPWGMTINKRLRGMTMGVIASVVSVMLVAPASHAASVATSSLSAVRAYPNPWRSDKHMNASIKFDGMPAGSSIKFFTVSAHEVKTLIADSSGMASWDRTNNSGELVASGVYIYLIIDPAGNDVSGKLAIIK